MVAGAARGRRAVAVDVVARESLPILSCSVLAGLLAILIPKALSADGWLTLVGGRLIAHEGLPHHDVLATLTTGRAWVDQQWLGQLAAYGLVSVGGIRFLLGINVLLVLSAFVAAIVVGRARGGHPTTVAVVALLALLPFAVTAMNVRTQSFVYLAFVGLVVLLTRFQPVTMRAAIGILVLLVVWANVHGSVLLAATVVAFRGVTLVRSFRRSKSGWVMLVGPWIAVLVSPYHVHLLPYYAHTAFNSSFSRYLSQWAPTTLSVISAPLLVLLFATAWMLGRSTAAYLPFERLLIVIAVVTGLIAVRNWAFSTLLLIMLAPAGFDSVLRRHPAPTAPRIGAAIGAAVATLAIVGICAAISAPVSHLTRDYPPAAADVAARAAARPGATIYADIPFADWLVWSHPELAGRIVFDVRYELLRSSELRRLLLFDAGSGLDRPLGNPTVYLLSPGDANRPVAALRPDVRTVYKTDEALVAAVHDAS